MSASTLYQPLCPFLRICSPMTCQRSGLFCRLGTTEHHSLFAVQSPSGHFVDLLHLNLQEAKCSAPLGPLCTPRSLPDHMFLLLIAEWILGVPVTGPRGQKEPPFQVLRDTVRCIEPARAKVEDGGQRCGRRLGLLKRIKVRGWGGQTSMGQLCSAHSTRVQGT